MTGGKDRIAGLLVLADIRMGVTKGVGAGTDSSFSGGLVER